MAKRTSPPTPASLLLPTAPKVLERAPLEEILLMRDEVANMVWGVEKNDAVADRRGQAGTRSGARNAALLRDETWRAGSRRTARAAPRRRERAQIRYQVMTTVPGNWVPFMPVHVPGDNTRDPAAARGDAAHPRGRARASLRRASRRAARCCARAGGAPPVAYFVHEEEVPRAGVRVTQRFQRTRWRDGRAWVWLGVRKQTGRGEGSSGLAFDTIESVTPKT